MIISNDPNFKERYLKLLNEIFNPYGRYFKYERVNLLDICNCGECFVCEGGIVEDEDKDK